MVNKKSWLAILLMVLLFGIAVAENANAQTIQGAWELRTGSGVHVISFFDGTFTYFLNGNVIWAGSGIYTLDPATWGVTGIPNNPRNLYIEFGVERDWAGFSFNISANELVLSRGGWPLPASMLPFPMGTYRRIAEPTDPGNPLVGSWRIDFTDDQGRNQAQIFRFFPNGQGALFTFHTGQRNVPREMAHFTSVSYELGTTPGTGQVLLLDIDWGTFDWVVSSVFPFRIDGNVLHLEGISAEYFRR